MDNKLYVIKEGNMDRKRAKRIIKVIEKERERMKI